MASKTVLALDFGTSSIKSGIIDSRGELLWTESKVFPQVPDYDNWETNQWIYCLEQLFTSLAKSVRRGEIGIPDAVSISGNGPTLVAMGANYADRRQASWPVLLWMKAPDERVSGHESFYLPKINWMRHHHPAEYQSVRRFMSGPEYIAWVLSGSEATITPHDDFTPYIWTRKAIRDYGLDDNAFPPFVNAGEVMGRIDRRGAEISGLPEGIPVVAAGSDFLMSLLGTGVIEDGLTCDRAGTSEGINYCSDRKVNSEHLRVLPHAVPGKFNVAGILASTGRMFEWFRSFSHQREISYMEMMQRIVAADSRQAAPWFFPSVQSGHSWDFKGGMFAGLQPEHSSADLGRAVVNAIGFSIRSALEYLDDAGCTVSIMRSCGGQAKNGLWCQMKSDITGVPIEVPMIKDAELTGCAAMGFHGIGAFTGIEEAVGELVHIESRFEPDTARIDEYRSNFLAWKESYAYIREAARHLPGLTGPVE
jgi:xylulokinase